MSLTYLSPLTKFQNGVFSDGIKGLTKTLFWGLFHNKLHRGTARR